MKKLLLLIVLELFIQNINAQIINVSTSTELQNALNAAQPGHVITLANGTYKQSGGFKTPYGRHGTANQPIKIVGNANTVITCDNLSSGYGFGLKGNNYWILDGFSVWKSSKAIVFDSCFHSVMQNIKATYSGYEALHLRQFSSYCTISNCYIDSTGSYASAASSGFAEGIYVGSAKSNWASYSGGNPDTCNYNIVDGNVFGAHIISENIDIKEGTKYGVISNNTFDGAGCNGANSADSWVDVKGNYYIVECNTGTNSVITTSAKQLDGFQTHIQLTGWGAFNTFRNNTCSGIGSTGYAIKLQKTGSTSDNIVCNTNTVNVGALGLANVTAQNCSVSGQCMTTELNEINVESNIRLFPNPASSFIELRLKSASTARNFVIIDVMGKVAKAGEIDLSNPTIGINELSAGLYFLHLVGTAEIIKFIKE